MSPSTFRVLLTDRAAAPPDWARGGTVSLLSRLGRRLRPGGGGSEAAAAAGPEAGVDTGVDAVVEVSGASRPTGDEPIRRVPLPAALGDGELLVHRPPTAGGPDASLPPLTADPEAWNIVVAQGEDPRPYAPTWFHQVQHFLDHQADLVLGHGTVQQVMRSRRRWAMTTAADQPLRTVLEIAGDPELRTLTLALYPQSDHTGDDTDASDRDRDQDLDAVREALRRAAPNGWSFADPQIRAGHDELGPHLRLPLGTWAAGRRPRPVDGLLEGRDPDETEPFLAHREIRQGLERFSPARHLGSSLNAEAAERAGAEVTWVTGRTAIARTATGRYLIDGYLAHSSQLGSSISTDKYQTNRHLRRAGVPVAEAALARSPEQAWEKAQRIGLPVVVKPADREKGLGVSTGLRDEASVVEAYRRARRHSRRIMVEQHVDIETELRVMASAQDCVSITARTLPEVRGDGLSTIGELVAERNAYRSTIFSLAGMDAVLDEAALRVIAEQGYQVDDVPPVGEMVTVGTVGGQSSGGDIAELSHTADGRIRDAAVAAVAAIPDLRWGGVDLMVERGTGEVSVLEVNSRAGYGSATFPSSGASQDVAGHAWRLREEHTQARQEAADSPDAPAVAARVPAPIPPVRLGDLPYGEDPETSPARLLFAYASHLGCSVSRSGPRLREITGPHGAGGLLSTRALGPRDLAIACRITGRLGAQRRLLLHAEVPLVPAVVVYDEQELAAADLGRPARATPYSAPWASRLTRTLEAGDSPDWDRRHDRWIVQEVPTGRRLRLLTVDGRVPAVLGSEEVEVDQETMRRCVDVAVAAVRAVPQLRWAVVDLVVAGPDATAGAGGPAPELFVEGMSLAPRLHAEEAVVAGRLEDFLDRLLPEAVADEVGLSR